VATISPEGAVMLTRDGAIRMDLQAQERQNADMRQQRARRMDQVRRLLVETSEALAGSTNLRSSLNAVAHAAVTGLADWCIVDLLDEHGTLHRAAAAHADPRLQRTVEELRKRGASGRVRFDLVWEVLRGRQPRLESEVSELLRMALTVDAQHEALLQRLGFASLLVVPLLVADRVLGALTLVRGPHDLPFNAEDVALADAWAHQCAQALQSVRRYAAERRAHRAAETRARERTAALEKIDDAVVIANGRGHFRFMNPAARALFGAAKLSSRTELPLLAENGQALEEAANPLTRAQRDRAHVGATELRIRRPDGTDAIVEAVAAPLPDGRAAAHGAVLSLHDVTAWRERERRRDESFANASHDLRTPVAAISGAIEVFLRDAPPGIPPPLYHMLLIIEQETARLRALVDDVLELTSVEAGRTRLRLTRLDLRALLRHSARAVEPLLKRRGQRIVLDLPRRPLRHTIDSQRLQRAVLNLLSNAQEHSPSGGTIWLGLERQADEALLSIRDSGPGIPFEEQERIFERFYRGSGAAHHRGSGLGLPIAAAMVELHGGRIWVESAPGAGATFCIALPMPPRRRSVRKGAAKTSALAGRPPL
jgi:PAS domain S-box-containing protein